MNDTELYDPTLSIDVPAPAARQRPVLEKVPPHDERNEAAALGSMFDPDAADIVLELLTLDDFYLPRHKVLFEVLSHLFSVQENLDEILVVSELTRRGRLDQAGGRDYVGQIALQASPANVEGYCSVVRARAIERELLEAAQKIFVMVDQPSNLETSEIVSAAEKLIYDVTDRRSAEDVVSMTALFDQIVASAEQANIDKQAGKAVTTAALPTQYTELDHKLGGGLWPGELVIVAGRPSMGKTTFAINIARKIITSATSATNKPVAIFSMEMPSEQVAKNILSAQAGVDTYKLRRFDLEEIELENLTYARQQLAHARLFIDDSSNVTIPQLRAKCRRLKHRQNIALIIVDYIQLMKSTLNHKASREQEVAEISRGLKAIARDLELPVIVISQLNRSAEKREQDDKRPQLSDLRDSGAIEQDADVVIGLYRAGYYDAYENAKNVNVGEAAILKNRNGSVGNVKLTFIKNVLRFESYASEPCEESA